MPTNYRLRLNIGSSRLRLAIPAVEPTPDPPAEPDPTTDVELTPGTGWVAPTAQPDPVGDSGDPYYASKAIARWDVVPLQDFTSTFKVGVVAFHPNEDGIEHIYFAVKGGAFVACTGMTVNATTGITEYNAIIDAADFTAGELVEVRAVAYPKNGVPRVLDSLYLIPNAGSTLPAVAKYVATNGNDTTGDGSSGNPYLTILKAAKAIQTANGDGSADGGIIYLKAGSYVLGTYSFGLLTTTNKRWLTIMPAPGVATGDAIITGSADSNGLRTKLVHLKNLKITGFLRTAGDRTEHLWCDSCLFVGPGRTVDFGWFSGFTRIDMIDCDVTASKDGCIGNIVRNCTIHDISQIALGSVFLAANITVTNIDKTGTEFHPDVWKIPNGTSNAILYGVTATTGIDAQGVFAGDNYTVTDVAVVNVTVNNSAYAGGVWFTFVFEGATTNLYVKDSSFTGRNYWATGSPVAGHFTATRVLAENTTFSGAITPNPLAGVAYR